MAIDTQPAPGDSGLRSRRSPWALALRLLFAAILLWLVIRQVHWNDYSITNESGQVVTSPGVISSIGRVHLGWLIGALAVSIASILVTALRWRLLLKAQDVQLSAGNAIRLHFVGEFFSTIMPGLVGGDLVKCYWVAKETEKKHQALVSVFVDRLVGICGMAATALIMLLFLSSSGGQGSDLVRISLPSVAAVCAGLCIMLGLLFSRRLRKLSGLKKLFSMLPISEHLSIAGEAVSRYRSKPGTLLGAFFIALAAQSLNSGYVLMLGIALGLDVSWMHYFLHVPLIMIISAVPITPGGIGVLEQLYLLYFAAAGQPSLVLAMAVLVRAVTLTGALPGGLVALASGISIRKIRPETLSSKQ